jgi:Tfp pilus assembly protein FimT
VATLLELVCCLALFTLLSYGAWQSVNAVDAGARLEAGRIDLVLALSEARRLAYLRQTTVLAVAGAGDTEVLLVPETGDPYAEPLPSGVTVSAAPARGGVLFHQSGWAENATFELGPVSAGKPGHRRVVVNQRGRIR